MKSDRFLPDFRMWKIRFTAGLLAFGILWPASGGSILLLDEDFESLPLGPFVSGTESGGDGTDWTDVPPAGWVRDNTTTPAGSPAEFFGWTFLDKNSWIATEGDQERTQFALGTGTVMVADPDAFDDGTEIDTGLFNAYISTPAFSLTGLAPGSVTLDFDSIFRAEVTQIAVLNVSFDGGTTFSNLLTLDSATLPDGQVFAEHLMFDVANPADGSLVFQFGMTNASNDWYWAIDNVLISADPIPEPGFGLLSLAGAALLGGLRRRRLT